MDIDELRKNLGWGKEQESRFQERLNKTSRGLDKKQNEILYRRLKAKKEKGEQLTPEQEEELVWLEGYLAKNAENNKENKDEEFDR